MDEWEIAPRFLDLLANTSVQFFKDRVKVLHPSDHWGMNVSKTSRCGGTVHLESGLLIEYDWYNLHFLSTSVFLCGYFLVTYLSLCLLILIRMFGLDPFNVVS